MSEEVVADEHVGGETEAAVFYLLQVSDPVPHLHLLHYCLLDCIRFVDLILP